MQGSNRQLVVSCEHGGNRLPAEFRTLFRKHLSVLETHRGYDIGALDLARKISAGLSAQLFYSTTTRLLVDLNRSPHHPRLFSEFAKNCDRETKKQILQKYYYPYRQQLEAAIRQLIKAGGPVLHLSIHSFTPRLQGRTRHADIGLLYDPSRRTELAFCEHLQHLLKQSVPESVIRRNYPYRGNADGLTTHFRKVFKNRDYQGVEIEVNQKLVVAGNSPLPKLLEAICNAVPVAQSATDPLRPARR